MSVAQFTIQQAVDLYYIDNEVAKKKYMAATIVTARFVWKDIFKNTLWTTLSEWKTVQKGDPYDYVLVPENAERIFSVSVVDDCGNLVPIYYNNRLNIVRKPTVKKCGCTVCNCAGLCADANALQMTTKLIFTINGVNYYQKIWVETCNNGDVIEYTETPVKKYNDLTGDGGDFNDDYNDDFSIGQVPFSDFTIIYIKAQRKICKLEVLPCGCPVESESNIEIFNTFCGCFLDCCSPRKKKCCDDFLANPNPNFRGEVKLSECNTKIYYKPSNHWRQISNRKTPEFLLINFQTNAETCNENVLIPEYALAVLFDGIDLAKKKRKDKYSINEKLAAKWQYEDSRNKLILYLNPFSLEELAAIQESVIRW